MLPSDAKVRKSIPIATGVIDYFPDALAAVAEISRIGNEQHHPGEPLHWDRSKSTDEADSLIRHFVERGKIDTDGTRHSAKVAWRALALLQKELEAEPTFSSDGWIEWKGGECPVAPETTTQVRFRDGYIGTQPGAGLLRWTWDHKGSDIVAYKVV